jgi:hypothetical protein
MVTVVSHRGALLAAGCDQPAEPDTSETAGPPALAQDPNERTFVGIIGGIDQRFEECLGEEILIEWTNRLRVLCRSPSELSTR